MFPINGIDLAEALNDEVDTVGHFTCPDNKLTLRDYLHLQLADQRRYRTFILAQGEQLPLIQQGFEENGAYLSLQTIGKVIKNLCLIYPLEILPQDQVVFSHSLNQRFWQVVMLHPRTYLVHFLGV